MSDQLLSVWKDGLSQSERVVPALMPGNIELDGRNTEYHLKYAAELAGQFNFYDFYDKVKGDWEKFFDSDPNVWATLMAGMDFLNYGRQFEEQRFQLYYTENDQDFPQALEKLFYVVGDMASQMESGYESIQHGKDISGMKTRLNELAQKCRESLSKLSEYRKQSSLMLQEGQQELSETGIFKEGRDIRDRAFQALPQIQNLFSDLLSQLNELSTFASLYLKNNPLLQQQYPAHLGLFICFLQLYDLLRRQFNGLTKKHLEYYYGKVLDINYRTELPDKVHLLFEPDINAERIVLSKGELLLAEIPGQDDPIKYALSNDSVITKASIEKLETLYISEMPVFGDEAEDGLMNMQVFKGEYQYISPEAWSKDPNTRPAWPLFGEDQADLGYNQRTMQDVSIGILLASPIFYLTGGNRNITIRFYLQETSYNIFREYVNNFAKAAKKTPQGVLNEILSTAFNIDYTSGKGWQPVNDYAVLVPGIEHTGDTSIEINCRLSITDESFAVYQPELHGPGYSTTSPVIRLLINNENSHNAYSFLRQLLIDKIYLRADVTEFRDFRVQNNIGDVSPAQPFQPFGPQPFIGSFIDIRNTNVFNRYTESLSFCIEWMELPRDECGFQDYFAAYDTGVDNKSFQVAISATTDGISRPASADQQQFRLFHTRANVGGSQLDSRTHVKDIDIKRMDFSNDPLLDKEETDKFFRNGVIRIELVSPPVAFGHTLYPRIFAETALHNARRFGKKLPLPNQPFTPKVKSLYINYSLEHTEAFKDVQEVAADVCSLELWHQYPSGFKKIYPADIGREINLIPRLEYPGNLFIGMNNLVPREEISLLFQVEEANYHHTLHYQPEVVWSYLVDDEWEVIDKQQITYNSTASFIKTGIIKIRVPANINTSHQVMENGLYWLKASVQDKEDVPTRVITIQPQVALANRVLSSAGTITENNIHLSAGSIKIFARKIQGIRNVYQLFPTFNGKIAEQDTQYYTRTSERLRHKQRLLTAVDIEQFVLEKFPSLSMVKCFGTEYHKNRPVYPGVNMHVIVLPKERADGLFDSDQPKVSLSTLIAIKTLLAEYTSPFSRLEVGNPIYERVKLAFNVSFLRATVSDSGFFLEKLYNDIKVYFCPWLYLPGSSIKIGSRVFLSDLLTYLKKLPYIAEISGFSAVHFFKEKDKKTGALKASVIDTADKTVDFIQGSIPEAILIPSEQHLIVPIDVPAFEAPTPRGIGDFFVGNELLAGYRQPGQTDDTDGNTGRVDGDDDFNMAIPYNI